METFLLSSPPVLLPDEQLFDVPERVGENRAGAVVADARVGGRSDVARSDGDDGQLVSDDVLDIAEDGLAARGVGLVRLIGGQLIESRLPVGRGLGLYRIPLEDAAVAL